MAIDDEPLVGTPDFNIKKNQRKCTDCLCWLLLIACWAAMSGIGYVALQDGDPYRLIAGTDYDGRICGYSTGVTEKPYLYYINKKSGVCTRECPRKDTHNATICMDTDDIPSSLTTTKEKVQEGYCLWKFESYDLFNYCIFEDEDKVKSWVGSSWEPEYDYLTDTAADIYEAKGVVFGFGFGLTVLLSFLFLLIIRIPGFLTLFIWSCIFAVGGLMALFCVMAYYTADEWSDEDPAEHEDYEIHWMKALAVICLVLAVIYVCLMCFMRKRIQLAIGLIKEAARAIENMPLIVLWPVIQAIGIVLFLVPWVIYVLYVASSGEIVEVTVLGHTTDKFEYSSDINEKIWYLIFSLFWTTQFIVALGEVVIAMAISMWYFTRDKHSVGSGTVISAIWHGVFYHGGTAAFGSLIIAVLKTVRTFLAYLQRQLNKYHNAVIKAVLCMLQCFFWCLEKCVKFMNENAYIQCAIFGTNFCASAKRAFFLILRNIARIAAVSIVTELVTFLGKIFVASAVGCLTYIFLDEYYGNELHSLVAPTILAALLAYGTAAMFMSVYEMATTALLHCFIADEEMFGGSGNTYADKNLVSWIDRHGKHPEK